jgi:uncharacterized membrane protein
VVYKEEQEEVVEDVERAEEDLEEAVVVEEREVVVGAVAQEAAAAVVEEREEVAGVGRVLVEHRRGLEALIQLFQRRMISRYSTRTSLFRTRSRVQAS